METKEIRLIDLPLCLIRKGRSYDGKAQITCGFRGITAEKCIECGGKTLI